MFSAKNLVKRFLDEDKKNEEGNQPPAKQAKIKLDDNNQADIQAAEDDPHLFARLPDEVMFNVVSHFVEPPTLNAFAQTNRRHYELISGGEKGDGALEYNIPFFNQPLTWREMPNQFKEKAVAQWEEVQIYLSLSNNYLRGPIQSELGRLSKLKYLFLNGNQLSGSIPSQLGQIDNLEVLSLNNNHLSDPVPEWLAQRFPHLVNSEGHIAGQQAV